MILQSSHPISWVYVINKYLSAGFAGKRRRAIVGSPPRLTLPFSGVFIRAQ